MDAYDWNDLRYLVAVADCGSTTAAARALGVNQSTVQRRLAELEKTLALRLFERAPSGYKLTPAGRALLPDAKAVAAMAGKFAEAAETAARADILRLTCPEPIAYRLTASGLLDRFHNRNPDYRIELVLSDHYADLAKGEADIALRSGDTTENLVGRKVADSLWAIYGSHAYLARHGAPADLNAMAGHPLIGFDHSLDGHRLSEWLREIAPDATYAARVSSVLGLVSAAKAGVGLAALPLALGNAEPDLARVIDTVPALTRSWRVLTHRDARQLPRVRAFFDFLEEVADDLKPILSG
jgi:DNA-binding transcriptional LysR family regulator